MSFFTYLWSQFDAPHASLASNGFLRIIMCFDAASVDRYLKVLSEYNIQIRGKYFYNHIFPLLFNIVDKIYLFQNILKSIIKLYWEVSLEL